MTAPLQWAFSVGDRLVGHRRPRYTAGHRSVPAVRSLAAGLPAAQVGSKRVLARPGTEDRLVEINLHHHCLRTALLGCGIPWKRVGCWPTLTRRNHDATSPIGRHPPKGREAVVSFLGHAAFWVNSPDFC